MTIEKTTIGGYAMAIGMSLGAAVAAIPTGTFDKARIILGVLAAGFGTFGSVILGVNARDRKVSDQQAGARVPDPAHPGKFVDRPDGVYVATVGSLRPPGN